METVALYLDQADAISLATAVILLIMSVITWAVIGLKYHYNRQQGRTERGFVERFWQSSDHAQVLDAHHRHPLGRLAQAGLAMARHCSQASRASDLDGLVTRALRQMLDAESAALEYGLTVLASIGSTAPFVGLFGTVWSVHRALLALGTSGQATLDKVAGPVGEALVMTGAGLAVAIPAVIAYNLFTRANRLRLMALDGFAYDLHAYLVAGMHPPMRQDSPPTDEPVAALATCTERG
ncbi:MAG: MotA/TolQ/ExbB proton channel family protein [Candidatus Contendobacter sp.]